MDEIGGLEDAIAFAAEKAGLGANYRVTEYPRQKELFEAIQDLVEHHAPGFAKSRGVAGEVVRRIEAEVKALRSYNDPQGIYARLPHHLTFR